MLLAQFLQLLISADLIRWGRFGILCSLSAQPVESREVGRWSESAELRALTSPIQWASARLNGRGVGNLLSETVKEPFSNPIVLQTKSLHHTITQLKNC